MEYGWQRVEHSWRMGCNRPGWFINVLDIMFGGGNIAKYMSNGLESSRDIASSFNEHVKEEIEQCDHSLILEEDIGYVCRVCGIIQRSIESIIEYQRFKESASVEAAKYM
ncbi:Helicase, C-terminal [Artemisia annua]|uniref:Helicase, C-terminal n=1 Tax=Artemisia annua TaxID=35608 RepID=A0A2U1KVG6_ARTAN|nr:Helicase, C-terminal [Artemisia annua]